MKKLFTLLFLVLFIAFSFQNSFAQQESEIQEKLKYDLAFPGILPDHPFYKLKILRDRIQESLISDPKQKIEFYLLQADKGILSTAILIDKKNINLAKETALKAENNYTVLINELYKLRGKSNDALFKKLRTAALKHQEVLQSLILRVPKEDQETFKIILEFSQRNLNNVESIKRRVNRTI